MRMGAPSVVTRDAPGDVTGVVVGWDRIARRDGLTAPGPRPCGPESVASVDGPAGPCPGGGIPRKPDGKRRGLEGLSSPGVGPSGRILSASPRGVSTAL